MTSPRDPSAPSKHSSEAQPQEIPKDFLDLPPVVHAMIAEYADILPQKTKSDFKSESGKEQKAESLY